ncbi:sulfotransferase family protein [Aestuariibius sp. 2305UL40-4]|uniref:sulfotransferase family protein n=1 Tax=Aestuariibius violaceus TaxID=3234132 RepID=UPI00345E1E5C
MTEQPLHNLHFITGLPRSGSTLLSAILRQNPGVHASISSPVSAITTATKLVMSQNSEVATLIDDEVRRRILTGVFVSYYSNHQDYDLILDTNRNWSSRIAELLYLFPGARFIVTVRDLAWVFDSLERILKRNALRQSNIVKPGASLATRMDMVLGSDGFIGGPLSGVKEAFFGPNSDRLLLIDYKALCVAPDKVLEAIYAFVGTKSYPHTFDDLECEEERFDEALNTPSLHSVRRKVELRPRKTILPPDVFQRLSALTFWTGATQSQATRILADRNVDED